MRALFELYVMWVSDVARCKWKEATAKPVPKDTQSTSQKESGGGDAIWAGF
jgi:hypothetical protein